MASLELRGDIWHLRFRDRRGKSRSISTKLHTSPKNDILAQKKLIAFEVDLSRGQFPQSSVKIGQLLDDVLNDYRVNHKKSLVRVELRIDKHLRPWFGEVKADRFGADDWRDYTAHRMTQGAKNASINLERANLMYGFTLAIQAGKLTTRPYCPRLKPPPPRSGFIDRKEMESLCRHLPEYLKSVARFAFLTGWRLGEIRQLQWRHVSFEAGEIRLDPGSTKNEDGRIFPMTEELRTMLEAIGPTLKAPIAVAATDKNMDHAQVATVTPYVFHCLGQPIGYIYPAWRKAVKAIGKPGLLFHDLRRSAIIDMDRRNIPRRVIQDLVGHKNPEMFERYRRVGKADLDMARKLMEVIHGEPPSRQA